MCGGRVPGFGRRTGPPVPGSGYTGDHWPALPLSEPNACWHLPRTASFIPSIPSPRLFKSFAFSSPKIIPSQRTSGSLFVAPDKAVEGFLRKVISGYCGPPLRNKSVAWVISWGRLTTIPTSVSPHNEEPTPACLFNQAPNSLVYYVPLKKSTKKWIKMKIKARKIWAHLKKKITKHF